MSDDPRREKKSFTFLNVDPETGELRFSTGMERAWRAYDEQLTDEQRRGVEEKCRAIGCDVREWATVLTRVIEDRADEMRMLTEQMAERSLDALLDALTTERLKGRQEIFRGIGKRQTEGLIPLYAKLDPATGMLHAAPAVAVMAEAYDHTITGRNRQRIMDLCGELGCSFEHWSVTFCAISIERDPEFGALSTQMAGNVLVDLIENLTIERTKGRLEGVAATRPARN